MGYKYLYDVQRLVSTIAKTEVRPPNYWVSKDSLTYTVGRCSLHIDDLRRGIKDAYEQLGVLLKELVGDLHVDVDMKDVVDDISNTTRGYSFSSESPFAERQHQLFLRVVKEKKLGVVDAEGNFIWNKPAMRGWLLVAAKFWNTVAWLLVITAQVSTRMTQNMETTFCNDDHLRSIIIQGQEMILLLRNHKSSHLTERDSCTPSFVPPILAHYILQARLLGLREAEAIMVYHECGPEAAEIHRT